jgi:hypothetical protein
MSYLSPLKALLVEAVLQTFDQTYPVAQFRDVHCSIEYPVEKQQYPGIWVDYDDTKPLQTAGVDHLETTVTGGTTSRYRRWKFAGYASYTIAALTSLERDRLYDEMVRVLAFGDRSPATLRFRSYIESNDLMAANFDFDQIETRGNAAVPGTPWGTDEIIYERTLTMEVVGEFVSDAETGLLVPLSAIHVLDPDVYFTDPEAPPPMQVSDPTGGWI